MHKKTIKYTDYNGQQREEDFYFEISESEMFILEVSTPEGYLEHMRQVGNSHDGAAIMAMFRNFLHAAYGEKSPDGKYFDKSDEISRRFEHTRAYNVLFMELVTDAKKAAAFVSACLPFNNEQRKDFDKKVDKMIDEFNAQIDKEEQERQEEAAVTPVMVNDTEV